MYQVGDLVLYGLTGVCRVDEISMKTNMPGIDEEQLYYTLKPLYQDYVIYTPVENTTVFMRYTISKEEAEKLIDKIPSMQVEIYHNKVLSQLADHYEEALQTCDCESLMALTRSINAKKKIIEDQKRKFGSVDADFMKRAEELLFGELAVALNISKESVPEYIEKRIASM